MDKLTVRQKLFIEYYLQGFSASEAARRAGYKGRSNTIGSRLLTNDDIQQVIAQRVKEIAMTANEALARLAAHARGDMSDFLSVSDNGTYKIDLNKAQQSGKLHLIKRLTVGKGTISIELYDAQNALIQLLRLSRFALPSLPDVDIDSARERLLQRINRVIPPDWLQ